MIICVVYCCSWAQKPVHLSCMCTHLHYDRQYWNAVNCVLFCFSLSNWLRRELICSLVSFSLYWVRLRLNQMHVVVFLVCLYLCICLLVLRFANQLRWSIREATGTRIYCCCCCCCCCIVLLIRCCSAHAYREQQKKEKQQINNSANATKAAHEHPTDIKPNHPILQD